MTTENKLKDEELGAVIIRQATSTDTDAVSSIVTLSLGEFGIQPDKDGLDRELFNVGNADKLDYLELVAVIHGKIVGVAVLHLKDEISAHLCGLYLSVSARGKGLGKKLLDEAVKTASARGIYNFTLDTRDKFEAAISLYEKSGWVRGEDKEVATGPDLTYSLSLKSPLV